MKSKPVSQSNSTFNTHQLLVYGFCGLGLVGASGTLWWLAAIILQNPFTAIEQVELLSTQLTGFFLAFLLLLSFFSLTTLLVESTATRYGLYLAASCGSFLLRAEDWLTVLILAVSILVTLLITDHLVRLDLRLHLSPRLFHIFAGRIALPSFAFSLIFSFLLFQSGSRNLGTFELRVPDQLLDQGLDLATPILEERLASESQDMLLQQAVEQLDQQIPAVAGLPYEDKAQLLQGSVTPELREQLRRAGMTDARIDQIARDFQAVLTGDLQELQTGLVGELTDQVKIELTDQLNKIVKDNKELLPWLLATTTFFVLSSLSFIFRGLAIGIAATLLPLLTAIGWIEKVEYQATASKYQVKEV